MDTLLLQSFIDSALAEDMAFTDLTAQATISQTQQGKATIIAKADGVLSGCAIAQQVFNTMDTSIHQAWHKTDQDQVQAGDIICQLEGNMRMLLSAERTALNFMQHLSGIATATALFIDVLKGTNCDIVDTRKTTPGLRLLEKKAVVDGGGRNHRMDLASGMLIKENHIEAAGSITDAVAACQKLSPNTWIEVECETLDEVVEAVHVCPDIILLDNMDIATVEEARKLVPSSILLEASGNITLTNARNYAQTGINRIAVGAITHSAPSLDLSMRVSRLES
ncbi:carboxylating nicotinate-nucleotide diphosphorylase [Ghiorsea bivora]|uniref:carboxylating nicotinate-nucleotide diphosphorylase n=1 Tax=Ghiorsea bivora TaxID=1485545 RepID=UPI0005700635|nr:carboxylating nicotinate-nucleotide diphosphorylase [Ghiorsea bivora]